MSGRSCRADYSLRVVERWLYRNGSPIYWGPADGACALPSHPVDDAIFAEGVPAIEHVCVVHEIKTDATIKV
eukprot:CAMPEP_0175956386 /NCGR_PEP_ID=MMETSP0108-20121206/33049_1 /TAXON_ID=195067 ORGANISM="Goniomonas pacifica, Strain CCMP1869" /NCGR_SAMPLE_ID=MMETSP0108 /ASSEMBLY_ACC=CAM_ASM_000204 /LENGTH=71 /DNA_ID=CAMNT_0017283395 /DNA_START=118 /DNA_END=333 /DNA_ORIENTATION=+